MVHIAVGGIQNLKAEAEVAQAEAPEFEKVNWLRDPGLRKLYCWAAVLCIASATTGYDGYASQRQPFRSSDTDHGQNDVEYLPKSRFMAGLLWNSYWRKTGLDECHLSDWQFGQLSHYVSLTPKFRDRRETNLN